MFLRYYYRMVTFYNITLSTAFSLLMLSVAEAARPNVVLINADDLGWAEVGCYGQKKLKPRTLTSWPPKDSDGFISIPELRFVPLPAMC